MKKTKSPQLLRAVGLLSLATLLVFQFVGAFLTRPAYATQITDRSLLLVAGATDGGSKPGGVVNHKFSFTLPTAGTVGSLKFEYCTTAADVGALTCIAPTGLSVSSATFGNETGSSVTGFGMGAKTVNSFILTRTAAGISANAAVKVQANSITNPTTLHSTFFVRISSYAAVDASGVAIDKGTVAATVTSPIVLDGTMPESLVFCTGETVGLTASVPDCGTATAGVIHFNQLFSPTATATSLSQMAASTNAGSGYSITVNGTTLTSGANTISGMASPGASTHGVSQFGINLVANTIDIVSTGIVLAPASNTTNYRGQPLTDYATADSFKFVPGEAIANSGNAVLGGTDAQIYTVTYIANVPGSLPAGNYSTTLTYICTPTY